MRQLKKTLMKRMNDKRNIKNIAPFLADDFVDLEEQIFDTDKYSIFLNTNSKRIGTFKKYLICKLHDSWVIQINNEINIFNITLNDFSTYVFADTIIEKFNLPIECDNISFPMSIEFKGNINVEYNKVDSNGNLIQIKPTEVDEYLYEQITQIDKEKIEIVIHFWKSNLKYDKPGEQIIVIISANELNIVENQDEAWVNIFGNQFDEHYKYFKEQFNTNRNVSDHNECEKLIEEYEQQQINEKRKPNA